MRITRVAMKKALVDVGYSPSMANHILAQRRAITFDALVELEKNTGVTSRQLKAFIESLPKRAYVKRGNHEANAN